MNRYTFSPQEEAEFDMVMAQAREDAWTFGISQRFEAYLEQFAPEERMQHVLAMFAALENQFELCQRLLAIKFSERDKKKAGNPSKDRDVVELVRELALVQPDSLYSLHSQSALLSYWDWEDVERGKSQAFTQL